MGGGVQGEGHPFQAIMNKLRWIKIYKLTISLATLTSSGCHGDKAVSNDKREEQVIN